MNIRESVFQACDELGTRTSLNELYHRAAIIHGSPFAPSSATIYRCHYRKKMRIKGVDCRTYKGQPRRNMLNDNVATLGQVKRIKHVLSLKRVMPESLLNLLGEGKDSFHSIDQIRNAIEELIELRRAA